MHSFFLVCKVEVGFCFIFCALIHFLDEQIIILSNTLSCFFKVVAKPGSCKTYKKFEAEIYVLTKDEGGRHTAFFSNYRPQFYLRTADVTGKVELPENVKMVMPGDNVTATFELISAVPLEPGKYNFFLVLVLR